LRSYIQSGLNHILKGLGEMGKVSISMPRVPKSQNVLLRMHWAKRRKLQEEWIDEVYWTCKGKGLIPKKPFKRARVRIRYYFPTRRRRDKDNYNPKLILDALRYAGILEDDSVENIDLDWEIRHNKKARTEIEVQEIETK